MLASLSGAAATMAAVYGLGSALTRRSAGSAVSLGVGAAFLSLLIFALMAAHQATLPALSTLLGACILLNLLPPRPRLPRLATPYWIAAILSPFAIYAAVNAMAPEIEADANVYHLRPAIDSEQQNGFSRRIDFYERLPQAAELLYVPAFRIGGAPAARLVHLGFLMATLPLIAGVGMRFGLSPAAAWTAAAMYGISPVVLVSASSAFNDATLVFATVATVATLTFGGPVWIAGLLAGFCYGIKMTGGVSILVGLVWLTVERRFRAAILFSVAAAIPMAPWLLRNLLEIHNPFAPFGNRWFPNPLFHILSEQQLSEALRSYGIGFRDRFPEILWGWRLHGIIGPLFAIAPLALIALRNRTTAVLIALTAALSIPWWLNAGARFLLPSLPFLTLALASVLPGRLLPAVLVLHAISCWPQVIERYSPTAWHLHVFPLQAALGLESQHDYLWRTNGDYHIAKLVEAATMPRDHILDLHGIHVAHIRRSTAGWWHSAWSENAMRTLDFARQPGEAKLFETRAVFPPQPVRGIRIRPSGRSGGSWSIVEVEVRLNGNPILPAMAWNLSARPNRWETPLAFDCNLATRWEAWQPAEKRHFLAADFVTPVSLDTVRVISTHWDAANTGFDIDLQQPNGVWAAVSTLAQEHSPLDLRREAMRYVKRLGFTHIAGRAGREGTQALIHSLATEAPEWNVDVVAEDDAFYILKVR